LQDLGATFVADRRSDTGIDFIVAFPNGDGGTNFSAVEVKATEHPIGASVPLEKKWYQRPAHSNVPSLFLVVDVKRNRLYHAWPGEHNVELKSDVRTIRVPVTPIDDSVRESIRKRLSGRAKSKTGTSEHSRPVMESRC